MKSNKFLSTSGDVIKLSDILHRDLQIIKQIINSIISGSINN
jgi:hypothetical protein